MEELEKIVSRNAPFSLDELEKTLDEAGIKEARNPLHIPPSKRLKLMLDTDKSAPHIFFEFGFSKRVWSEKDEFATRVREYGLDKEEALEGNPKHSFFLFYVLYKRRKHFKTSL